jgi:phosphoglycerate dehydrogenase-like enzyme
MAKALVTSEVTETFMAQLEARGYQPRHIGWGHNGIALTEEEMEREIAECEIAIVEVENLSASTLVKAKSLKFIGVGQCRPRILPSKFHRSSDHSGSKCQFCSGLLRGDDS